MVNGLRIDRPMQLRSGHRIILGDFHIFRFNNPGEVRAERAEIGKSLLRHSVHASQLNSPSPAPRPGHDRTHSTISVANSDFDPDSPRASSPAFWQRGKESEFSFARSGEARLGEGAPIVGVVVDIAELIVESRVAEALHADAP